MITNRDNALDDAIAPAPSKGTAYNPPRPIVELTENVYQHLQEAYNARAGLESDWCFFTNFIEGDQDFLRDNKTGGLVRIVNTEKKRLWSRNNQVKPLVRSYKGKIVRTQNLFTVRPGSGSEDEIYGGRLAERYLEYWSECVDLLGKYARAVGTIPAMGHGVLHLYRDPEAGDHVASCEQCGWSQVVQQPVEPGTPCPFCQQQSAMSAPMSVEQQQEQAAAPSESPEVADPMSAEMSAPVPMLKASRAGKTKLRYLDPRMVYPQPGFDSMDDMERFIIRYPLPVTAARRRFPHIAEYINPETDIYPAHGARYTYNTAMGRFTSEQLDDRVFVVECYTRPDSEHPKGRVIQFVNRVFAGEGEGTWDLIDRFPFYFFFGDITPGEFYPTPIMADIWHRQKELNEHETTVRENAELASRQKIAVASEARFRTDELTAAGDQIVRIPSMYIDDVKPIPTPKLDPIHIERPFQLKDDMRSMIGVTSQESNQGEIDVGRVIAFQEAESDQTQGPVIAQHNRELAQIGYGVLAYAKAFDRPETFFSIEGDFGLEYFSLMALNFEPGYNVMLLNDDGFSRNQAVRLNQIIQAAAVGMFGGMASQGADVNAMIRAARLKIPGHKPDATDPEQVAARAAIRKIMAGKPYFPRMQDDPETFANALVYWLRTTGRQEPYNEVDEMGMSVHPVTQQIEMLQNQYAMKLLGMMQASGQQPAPVVGQQQSAFAGAGGGGGEGGQPSAAGSSQSAPGGTPNSVVGGDADQLTASADQAGKAVTGGGKQEGPQS